MRQVTYPLRRRRHFHLGNSAAYCAAPPSCLAPNNEQEVLPMQQRLVKYLTEDKVFGAQILCSAYFLISAVRYYI